MEPVFWIFLIIALIIGFFFLLKLITKTLKVVAVLLIIILVLGFLGYINAPKWIKTGASYGWKGIKTTGSAVKWLFVNRDEVEDKIDSVATKINDTTSKAKDTIDKVKETKENVEIIVNEFKE